MNSLTNLLTIIAGTQQQLLKNDPRLFFMLLGAGLLTGVLLWLICTVLGHLFFKPYRMSRGQHVVCALLTGLLIWIMPLYASTHYLQTSLTGIIGQWRDTLTASDAWRDRQFRVQYHQIKRQGLEDFSNYKAPENGGEIIPANHAETRVLIGQMTAEAAIENFRFNYPLMAVFIGAKTTVPTQAINEDVNRFFKENPGMNYPHARSIQLAVELIYRQLDPQLPRIIWAVRIALIGVGLLAYLGIFGWIIFSALKQIRIFSAHHSKFSSI